MCKKHLYRFELSHNISYKKLTYVRMSGNNNIRPGQVEQRSVYDLILPAHNLKTGLTMMKNEGLNVQITPTWARIIT